jgi:hypothetical protein
VVAAACSVCVSRFLISNNPCLKARVTMGTIGPEWRSTMVRVRGALDTLPISQP